MHKHGFHIRLLASIGLLIAAVVLRMLQVFTAKGANTSLATVSHSVNIAMLICILASIAIFIFYTFSYQKHTKIKHQFPTSKASHNVMNILTILMLGLFVIRVYGCYTILSNEHTFELKEFIQKSILAVASILCAAYFFFIANSIGKSISFENGAQIINLVPVLWALLELVFSLTDYSDGLYDIQNTFLNITLIFALICSFIFANFTFNGTISAIPAFVLAFSYMVFASVTSIPYIASYVFGNVSTTNVLICAFNMIYSMFMLQYIIRSEFQKVESDSTNS